MIYVVRTKEINLSEKFRRSLCVICLEKRRQETFILWQNQKEITVYVYTQIQNGMAIKVSFQWLYFDSCITTLSDFNVSNSTYYFAFAGRSNNTHPMVKQIQVLN